MNCSQIYAVNSLFISSRQIFMKSKPFAPSSAEEMERLNMLCQTLNLKGATVTLGMLDPEAK